MFLGCLGGTSGSRFSAFVSHGFFYHKIPLSPVALPVLFLFLSLLFLGSVWSLALYDGRRSGWEG